jgi:hypothetical protein
MSRGCVLPLRYNRGVSSIILLSLLSCLIYSINQHLPISRRQSTTNLIPQHNLRTRTLPTPIPSRTDHKPTRRINMQSRNNTSAMTRYNQERNRGSCILHIAEIVETEDIVGSTVDTLAGQEKEQGRIKLTRSSDGRSA